MSAEGELTFLDQERYPDVIVQVPSIILQNV
jgi:hypothetical protein